MQSLEGADWSLEERDLSSIYGHVKVSVKVWGMLSLVGLGSFSWNLVPSGMGGSSRMWFFLSSLATSQVSYLAR
jgi:hypothetical protein